MVVHGRWDGADHAGLRHGLRRPADGSVQLQAEPRHVLRKFGDLIVMDTPMAGIFARAIGDFGYILRHPDEAQVTAAARAIQVKVGA